MSKLPNLVLGRYGIVLDVSNLFLGATLSAILGAITYFLFTSLCK